MLFETEPPSIKRSSTKPPFGRAGELGIAIAEPASLVKLFESDETENFVAAQASPPTLAAPDSAVGAGTENLPSSLPSPVFPSETELRDNHPLSDQSPPQRPGVSNRTLRENGVEITTPGPLFKWGLRFRYYAYGEVDEPRRPIFDEQFPDQEFCRERLAHPRGGQKYSQRRGTSPHLYFPKNLAPALDVHGYPVFTEGEAKTLALSEAGYPAVGIGGIDCFQTGGVALPELVELCELLVAGEIRVVHFLGDADTALNPGFARAVVRLRDLFAQANFDADIRLPRMPLDFHAIKGIDDAKAGMNNADFVAYFEDLLAAAEVLGVEDDVADVAGRLFDREEANFCALAHAATKAERTKLLQRAANLANSLHEQAADELAALAVRIGLVNKLSQFTRERKRESDRHRREMQAKKEKNRELVNIYYYPLGKAKYLYQVSDSEFTSVDRRCATNRLIKGGYSNKSEDGGLSETDKLLTACEQLPIDFAGKIAGRSAGYLEQNAARIVVTRGPTLLEAKAGDWSTLRAFLGMKFDGGPTGGNGDVTHEKQLPYFLGWLSLGVRDLYLKGGRFTPAQGVVFCGPARAGKNLTQDILTELFGRKADPFPFFEGNAFCGELLGAEHWEIADQQRSVRNADRERMKSCIKQACVNASMSINGKFTAAINLQFFRRLSISLNDQVEALRVLPELTSDFADKLLIFYIHAGLPFGNGATFLGYDTWWSQVKRELPAFLDYLLHSHVIRPEHRDLHYGVASYKNARILARIEEQSRESQLLELTEQHLTDRLQPWEGTARELCGALSSCGAANELATMRYNSAIALGRALTKLRDVRGDRVQELTGTMGTARYRILPRPAQVTALQA